MRLLFDQNLSHKLVRRLADIFPDCVHVRDVGLKAEGDSVLWQYARENELMIVSKDSDFHQRSFLYGYPPKVVWVRLGNCSTADVERVLRTNFEVVRDFYDDDYASFLSLSPSAEDSGSTYE